jgi:hypothetical protein
MATYNKPTKTLSYLLLRISYLPLLASALALAIAIWAAPQITIPEATNSDAESGLTIHSPMGYIIVVGHLLAMKALGHF